MNHFFKHIRSRRSARESEVPSDDKRRFRENTGITEKLNKFFALVCTVEKSWEVLDKSGQIRIKIRIRKHQQNFCKGKSLYTDFLDLL